MRKHPVWQNSLLACPALCGWCCYPKCPFLKSSFTCWSISRLHMEQFKKFQYVRFVLSSSFWTKRVQKDYAMSGYLMMMLFNFYRSEKKQLPTCGEQQQHRTTTFYLLCIGFSLSCPCQEQEYTTDFISNSKKNPWKGFCLLFLAIQEALPPALR